MLTAEARRRIAALRQPARAARIARALWIAWAVVVWNVVFDQVIVVTGRRYLDAVQQALEAARPLPRMDDWMRPAVARGFWFASAAGLVILVTGLVSVRAATRPRTIR